MLSSEPSIIILGTLDRHVLVKRRMNSMNVFAHIMIIAVVIALAVTTVHVWTQKITLSFSTDSEIFFERRTLSTRSK